MSYENDVNAYVTTTKPKTKKPAKNIFFEPLTDQSMVEKVRLTVKLHNDKYYPKLLNFGPWAKLVTFYFSPLIFLISFKSKSQSKFGLIVKD